MKNATHSADSRSALIAAALSRFQVAIRYSKDGTECVVVGRVVVVDTDTVAVQTTRGSDVWRFRISSVVSVETVSEAVAGREAADRAPEA